MAPADEKCVRHRDREGPGRREVDVDVAEVNVVDVVEAEDVELAMAPADEKSVNVTGKDQVSPRWTLLRTSSRWRWLRQMKRAST